MKTKILIVEDESIIAQDLQSILEGLGYDASEIATSGESALQKVDTFNPDLVLMDIRITGNLDSMHIAKIILQRFDIPVVYSIAHSNEDLLAKAKTINPYDYVLKPFDARELCISVETAIRRHSLEKKLKDNPWWFKTVLDSIGDGVISTDLQGYISFLNPTAENLTGWLLSEAIGKKATEVFKLLDPDTRQILSNPISQVLKTGRSFNLPQDTLLIQKDGREIYINDNVSPIIDRSGITSPNDSKTKLLGTVVVFQDVTQEKLATKILRHKAFNDYLTNLYNREWFLDKLTNGVERVKRNSNCLFAVLFLDLDRFKKINDNLGHIIGDKLLVAVAQRLLKAVRSTDTVSRIGGDEFAIILENMQATSESYDVAQRIIQELSKPFVVENNEVFTGTSIGIVFSSPHYQTAEDMLRDADTAMYRAKERGGNSYEVFNTYTRLQTIAASQLETELRVAVEESELNQLIVYYQPIVSLSASKIIGFEALVRWIHPTRGLISPIDFIGVAEETGLITKLDLMVLRLACRQLKAWQQNRSHSASLTMSVNLSSRHFTKSDCLQNIKAILAAEDVSPSQIKLEITETTLIANTSSVVQTLIELRKLGFALSLDDFGTGYSSLSYLQQLPLDVLKIDRCFVRDLHCNTKNAAITRALIEVAHQFNLTVVAEGVETEAELMFLSQNKCDKVQGYFFSPPRSATDLEDFKI